MVKWVFSLQTHASAGSVRQKRDVALQIIPNSRNGVVSTVFLHLKVHGISYFWQRLTEKGFYLLKFSCNKPNMLKLQPQIFIMSNCLRVPKIIIHSVIHFVFNCTQLQCLVLSKPSHVDVGDGEMRNFFPNASIREIKLRGERWYPTNYPEQ